MGCSTSSMSAILITARNRFEARFIPEAVFDLAKTVWITEA
jgi:hypothetical protein